MSQCCAVILDKNISMWSMVRPAGFMSYNQKVRYPRKSEQKKKDSETKAIANELVNITDNEFNAGMSADNDDGVKINTLIAAAKARLGVTLGIGESDWWKAASELLKLRPHDSIVELATRVVAHVLRKLFLRMMAKNAQNIVTAMINVYVQGLEQSFPVLDLNSFMKPSVNDVAPAQIVSHNNKTWLNTTSIMKIKTPVYKNDNSHLHSTVGAMMQCHSSGRLQYSSTRDVHMLCNLLVRDAMMSLGLVGKTKVRMENSFYSLIPDMVVVEVDGRIVFVIEVKCPEIEEGEVFKSAKVGGQIWLYLMAMKQHGCERPMGAIMTFNQICLVSLEDLGAYDHHKTLLQEVESLDHELKIIDTPVAPNKPPVSPSSKSQNVTAPLQEDVVHSPVVYYSEVYGGNTVFAALLQGILVAYLDTSTQDIVQNLPTVNHGQNLGGRLFARIGAYPLDDRSEKKGCGLQFVTTRTELVANEKEFPPKSTVYYYMLDRLGAGKQGCCYVACNSSGRLCCLKLYRPVAPKHVLPAKDWDKQIERLSQIAKEEERRWEVCYDYKEVRSIMLGDIPALVMPYLHEIGINERQSALGDVEAHLKNFASKGFMYNKRDLCWRHVLKDYEGNVFLADLGSLVEGADDSSVKEQVEELQKCMGNERSGLECQYRRTNRKAPPAAAAVAASAAAVPADDDVENDGADYDEPIALHQDAGMPVADLNKKRYAAGEATKPPPAKRGK